MKRAWAALLCVACTACATTTQRPRQLLSMPVALPACLFACTVRVTVTDEGAAKAAPESTPLPPTTPRH